MRYILLLFSTMISFTMAQTISLNLKNAPTAEIISYLAEESGKNVVLSDNLSDTKSLRLENFTFEQILQSLAKLHQFSLKQEKGIYYISEKPLEPAKVNPIASITPKMPKLITKTIKLHYAKASEVIHSLTQGSGTMLAENGYIHFDERSNSVIIKDTATSIKNLRALIAQLDQPTEQIAIEARIVTINSENLQELGVRWGMFSPNTHHHRFSGNLEGSGLPMNNLNVNFPVNNAASMVLQVASINSRVLDLELTALERENSVEIIASPRLLTTNKKSANIKQGTEIPYAVYSQKDELRNIEFREAVLGLEVTPHLSKNNQILLDLVVSQNSPNSQTTGSDMVTIDKQEINTQVFAKHGETIVLGGIFQHLIAKGEDRVPILGSIPVIKRLFSQSRDKIAKRELVIFVTPYIVKSERIEN
ncbi:secretin [Bibersteinia trehalosi Y31]|uniref:Secretin n=1 Tax=Bibersteinia trehalosi Y31 TaxID=1261658 RepID=A0A179CWU3_BIBTR|nr:type IV pilus secretin PilQ [Bibersteinia trehalosi]OAQ14375.1 secretin [Bibersteinia trehalosi Y31]